MKNNENNFYSDSCIVDGLLEMKESLYNYEVKQGERYKHYSLSTQKNIKLFDVIETKNFFTGNIVKIKVMSIEGVNLNEKGGTVVHFLGEKLN